MTAAEVHRTAQLIDDLPRLAREARVSRGLSLRAAASEIGVVASTLHRIERGHGFNSRALPPILRWIAGFPSVDRQTQSTPGPTVDKPDDR